jgi:methylmalonyl-CoA mutase cobalamin-binding subunit
MGVVVGQSMIFVVEVLFKCDRLLSKRSDIIGVCIYTGSYISLCLGIKVMCVEAALKRNVAIVTHS